MRLTALSLVLLIAAAASARAADGPLPPHAPTPDEAAAAMTAASSAPAASQNNAATPAKPAAADANAPVDKKDKQASGDGVDAVRKAQEDGSYKTKDGGMYQPPQSRPAPLWNEGYGRT